MSEKLAQKDKELSAKEKQQLKKDLQFKDRVYDAKCLVSFIDQSLCQTDEVTLDEDAVNGLGQICATVIKKLETSH